MLRIMGKSKNHVALMDKKLAVLGASDARRAFLPVAASVGAAATLDFRLDALEIDFLVGPSLPVGCARFLID